MQFFIGSKKKKKTNEATNFKKRFWMGNTILSIKQSRPYFLKKNIKFRMKKRNGNDPSAGSPTEQCNDSMIKKEEKSF